VSKLKFAGDVKDPARDTAKDAQSGNVKQKIVLRGRLSGRGRFLFLSVSMSTAAAVGQIIGGHRWSDLFYDTLRVSGVFSLLTAMRGTERVDIEDLLLARLHCRTGPVDQSCGEPRRLRLARRIVQTPRISRS